MTFSNDDNNRGRALANSYEANEARRNHVAPDIDWDGTLSRLNLTPIPNNEQETPQMEHRKCPRCGLDMFIDQVVCTCNEPDDHDD